MNRDADMSHSHPMPHRRQLLGAAAALCGPVFCPIPAARAQGVSTMGEVYVNGQRVAGNVALKPGDRVLTGPESTLTVAIGEDAFRLRPLTSVTFGGDTSSKWVTGLRVLSGEIGRAHV